jgi:hypothetical protein
MLPEFVPGYSKDVKPYDYNMEEAKKALAEAGYPNGFEFTVITYSNPRPYNPVNGEKLAAAIQADLAKIGDNGDPDNFLMLLDQKRRAGVSADGHSSCGLSFSFMKIRKGTADLLCLWYL